MKNFQDFPIDKVGAETARMHLMEERSATKREKKSELSQMKWDRGMPARTNWAEAFDADDESSETMDSPDESETVDSHNGSEVSD